MRAASLLGVLLVARALVLWDREAPPSLWTPIALLWQDLVVVLLFAALDRLLLARRPRLGWALYAILALHAAVNVPLWRVLSTPLTLPVLRAARGPLLDSIAHHATLGNVLCIIATLAAAAGLPWLARRLPERALAMGAACALGIAALGPAAASRVDTRGLHRSALWALAASAFPRLPAEPSGGGLFRSPFPAEPSSDLTRFRGAAAGRNVLLVVLESTGARHLKPYGAAEDPMPRLSELCREAVLFEDAYCVYPESIKGLVSVVSSFAPALDTPAEALARVPAPSLARELGRAGYRTALFHSGRFRYLGMEAVVRDRGFGTLEDAGDIGGNRRSSFGVDELAAVRRILSWIDGLGQGERFFAAYLPIAGHHPYESPAGGPFPDGEETGRYQNALHAGDAALGDLLDGLRARGLYEQTLVVVFGDHGEAFGDHEGNYGHTLFLYEENVRVPYLLALPGAVRAPVRARGAASLLDTAPTVLDLLGLPQPAGFQGRSLLDPEPRLALFFTDYSLALLGLRDGPFKFIHEIESGRGRLFDLRTDPGERLDLAAAHPERTEAYRDLLLRWSKAQRALVKN